MKRAACLFVLLLLAPATFSADEAQSLFHQGNQLYEQGDYRSAAETYERIIDSGKQSWQVYFNLGNAYYKLNETGLAILNYERALKLNSENEDVRFNLQLANLATVDRIPEPPKAAWITWVEGLFFSLSLQTLTWIAVALYALLMVLFALKNIRPEMRHKRLLRLMTIVLLPIFFVFAAWFGYRWYKAESEQYAIILQNEVSVTSAPAADATEVFALHEGTKLKVEQQSGEWVRIRLRDGKIGWLPMAAIGMI